MTLKRELRCAYCLEYVTFHGAHNFEENCHTLDSVERFIEDPFGEYVSCPSEGLVCKDIVGKSRGSQFRMPKEVSIWGLFLE
jgi:hypothetical protein